MEKMRWKLLRSKFARLVMLFFLVLGLSFFMYGGCDNNGEVCFFDVNLILGIADDAPDCISLAEDFDCIGFAFDPATGDCDGIDCGVCEDGTCNLPFEAPNGAVCDVLASQFECDEAVFIGIDCSLGDCNLCQP